MLGVSHQAVHVWHNAWTQGGAHAPAPGRQGTDTLLTPEQERELIALLMQGPGAYGWNDQQWTLARINRLISERFGCCYADPSGVWRMMDRFGLSWPTPKAMSSVCSRRASTRSERGKFFGLSVGGLGAGRGDEPRCGPRPRGPHRTGGPSRRHHVDELFVDELLDARGGEFLAVTGPLGATERQGSTGSPSRR